LYLLDFQNILIDNGATPPANDDEEGETVLIKHWW
jgi:hypothetical protein